MDAGRAWQVLGIVPGASAAEVRRAFRVSAQLLHPDRVADLSDDVRAEAHRRMVELADAYRVCSGLAVPGPADVSGATPRPAGTERAATMLAEARAALAPAMTWEAARAVVTTLEQVADAWPGTAEGAEARVLLVSSVAAASALSPRERAGHLVLVADREARDTAWEALWGRDELAIAQVVYAHPTVDDDLRGKARTRLVELDDWATLAADPDPDVRRTATAHLLLRESRPLADRAAWLSRRERPAFEVEYAAWRERVSALLDEHLASSLREDLVRAESVVSQAFRSKARA